LFDNSKQWFTSKSPLTRFAPTTDLFRLLEPPWPWVQLLTNLTALPPFL